MRCSLPWWCKCRRHPAERATSSRLPRAELCGCSTRLETRQGSVRVGMRRRPGRRNAPSRSATPRRGPSPAAGARSAWPAAAPPKGRLISVSLAPPLPLVEKPSRSAQTPTRRRTARGRGAGRSFRDDRRIYQLELVSAAVVAAAPHALDACTCCMMLLYCLLCYLLESG